MKMLLYLQYEEIRRVHLERSDELFVESFDLI